MVEVTTVPVGAYQANCYIVTKGNDTIIIDPGAEPEVIMEALGDRKVDLIVLTHGHFDHVGACKEIAFRTGAPVAVGTFDVELATNAQAVQEELGVSIKKARELVTGQPDKLLNDFDKIICGNMQFDVYETPGHTKGGICLFGEGVLFSGDTLFKGTMGRTDFATGDEQAMLRSLYRLGHLPAETIVYPGHGPKTTIGTELQTNQFMRFAMNHPTIAENL